MQQKNNKNKQGLQVVVVVLVAVLIVSLSVFTTVYVRNGGLSFSSSGGGVSGYQQAVPLGLAQFTCENHARQMLASRLRVLSIDSHSTRTEESSGVHRIYFTAELYPEEGGSQTDDYFVSCAVPIHQNRVSSFDFVQDVEFKERAVRATKGNAFGM